MIDKALTAQLDLVTVSVLGILFLLIMLFWQAARKGLSCLDLVTDKGSGKMSLTKVANLVGMVVGAWVVMRMAIDKSLTETILGIYLLYCAGTHGFSSYLSAKFNIPGSKPLPEGDTKS